MGAAVPWAGSLHAGAGVYHPGGVGALPVCMVVTHSKSYSCVPRVDHLPAFAVLAALQAGACCEVYCGQKHFHLQLLWLTLQAGVPVIISGL